VGVKTTLYLIDTQGIVPLSAQRDVAGPLTKTVMYAAIAMDALAGSARLLAALS